MNDPGAITMIVVSACIALSFSIRAIANAVIRHKELELRHAQPASSVSDDRMARLEMAVESIALEVERISEGQRYTTKLLSEAAQRSAPRLERQLTQDTPH